MATSQWQEINNQDDIARLMSLFGWFHDSCIKELYMWTDHYVSKDLSMSISANRDHRVRLLIQRQNTSPTAIELIFDELVQLYINPSPENYDSIIFGATFLHKDGLFYWADDSGWDPDEENKFARVNWMCSKKVKWRDVSDWMGETLRYGPKDNE
ncbi:hypothetical protein [Paenibacillus sp. 453mf]|uniref:hypothetical protein n=1 Tax=Paenibacillus sp. 453mf TaxID=1761874 RepID=UPI0008ECF744|nr:hypothetical protein [Paenibacillus sp. 453mf]SFS40979.1 hypothetical protein SAMN04488601_101427 [Paenibacillus sp. 453mf]